MSFVHLHVHSHYSLLDGLSKIDELVSLCKKYEMPAMALTDHGVMYGLIEFYQKAMKAGIKPILGVEAYVAQNGHKNKRPGVDIRPYHILLLAKNNEGYKNLIKLTTIAHLEGYYYKPRVDDELLKKYGNGIIAGTACLQGEIPRQIINNDLKAAKAAAKKYEKIFGKGNFYLEVQHHPSLPRQTLVNEKIFEISAELGIPVMATNDAHYPNKADDYAQDALLCIQTKKTLADKDRMSYLGEDFSVRPPEQMRQDFKEHEEAVKNTLEIAEKCQVELEFGKILLPHFEVPSRKSTDEYLSELCETGVSRRFGMRALTEEEKKRLDYELEIIKKTGYAPYFLIVADFINWAKDNKIVVGPGRGSAAGSLVAYLVGITDINPLEYNLIFERFLNPERISMPDIDTDFADSRRDEVIDYVAKKYGHDRVAQIITFGTMAARASVRDVGRVMGLPYIYCDKVAKMIPMSLSLDEAGEKVPELKEVIATPDGKKLIETAKRLEGCARHASTHACGIVITKESMDNYVPRQISARDENEIMTQYEMHAIEDLGLLKMDFLGLKNLTIIEKTLEILKKARGIEINLGDLPLDNLQAFKLLQRVETTGVFQLESSGMKRYLKQLHPTELEDIIAMVALYRPGPMEFISDFIDGKHGRRIPKYLDKRLEPILKNTYGIAVYQEQIMEIARRLAGFSYSEADVLRKAVGKKIASLLAEQEEKMIAGMIEHGISSETAKRIWEFILPFARYGFNRSHAACYALIAYQTAYLKANYPSEFMASLLTSDHNDIDRIAIEVEECRQMGLEVMPPDINESFSTFTVVYDSLEVKADKESKRIRFGLLAIKNLGENIVKEIIKERKANGHFLDLSDFLSRVKTKDLNKKSLEALIKSGALDKFGERNLLLYNIDNLLGFIKNINAEAESKQGSLLWMLAEESVLPKIKLEATEPAADKQKLTWEKELLGLYISAHPVQEIINEIRGKVIPISELDENLQSDIIVAGVVSSVKKIITKNNDSMAFAKVEDLSASIEVLVFPRVLQADPEIWINDNIILMSCRMSDKEGEKKLICNKAMPAKKETIAEALKKLEEIKSNNRYRNNYQAKPAPSRQLSGAINILMPAFLEQKKIEAIKSTLKKYPGDFRVTLIINNGGGLKKIATSVLAEPNLELKSEIEAILGSNTYGVEQKQ